MVYDVPYISLNCLSNMIIVVKYLPEVIYASCTKIATLMKSSEHVNKVEIIN